MKKPFTYYLDQQKLDTLAKKKKSSEKIIGAIAVGFFILFLTAIIASDVPMRSTVTMFILLIIAFFILLVQSGEKLYYDVFKNVFPY